MTETSQPDNGRAWAIGDGQPLEPSTWAHGEVITIRPRTSLADQIEDLLHEFDGVESKRIIADEIVNRLLCTEWATEWPDGEVRIAKDEGEARWIVTTAEPTWKLKCREVGPWAEVPRG